MPTDDDVQEAPRAWSVAVDTKALEVDLRPIKTEILKFPPLVVASSALLCAWVHLGNLKAIESHMHQLCAPCGVAQHELLTCKTILLEHFNTTYAPTAKRRKWPRGTAWWPR